MWKCKDCSLSFSGRSELLKHYQIDHPFHGRYHPYPCIHENCSCSSRTWNGLQKHLTMNHPQESTQKASSFKCYVCDYNQLSTEYDFFQHINQHLEKNELVSCMFDGCSYKNNIYGSFQTHKWRKHHSCTVKNLKRGIIVTSSLSSNPSDSLNSDLNEEVQLDEPTTEESRDFEKELDLKLASLLLKLEHTYLVSSTAVNELLEELQRLIGTLSVPVSQKTIINQFLGDNSCHVEASVVEELVTALCSSHPIQKAILKQGPLSTSWKPKSYYKREFGVVSPVEYILDKRNRKSLQYVSVLKKLQQILSSDTILLKTANLKGRYQSPKSDKAVYSCPFDGEFFRNNTLLSNERMQFH